MEPVVILHGLGRSMASMKKMAWVAEVAGFKPVLVDYPSTDKSIDHLVEEILPNLPAPTPKLNFIGHSLGGILAKRLAKRLPAEQRGRIVQIGAPNFGSEIAARASVFGPIMGPVLAELEPHSGDDDDGLEIGAIAGTAAHPAYGLITGIEGENDGKVCVRSAWGNAPADRRVAYPVAHSLMTNDQRVIGAAIIFLRTGTFPEPKLDDA